MSLMRKILEAPLTRDQLLVCYLGQASFILRSQALSVGMDLYLSNSCAKNERLTREIGVPLERQVPVFIAPNELEVDLVLATHDHQDHADPETLTGIKAEKTVFVGPSPVIKHLDQLGVSPARCVEINEGESRSFADSTIRAVYANHGPGSVGFIVEMGGLTTYVSGDSEFDERLFAIGQYKPDLMMICINGRWGNISSQEAVELTRRLRPKIVIPMHYDMFSMNTADPSVFAEAVRESDCGARPVVFEPGTFQRFSRTLLS